MLPRMQGDHLWVQQTEDLERLAGEVGRGPLAVDSEADSFHRYRERLCLLQLSFGGRDVLIDTLDEVDPRVLQPVLADRGVRKLLHGADFDLRLLHREYGIEVAGLFDTMIAARLVGEPSFGLAALLDKHCGVRLDKRHQRADWAIRPLPPDMADYAANDTRYLDELATGLAARLGALGRTSWAEEEFLRLEAVRWTGGADPATAYLRIKGVKRLEPRSLAIARELFELRDRCARERDLPPYRILRDEVIVLLTELRPDRDEAVERIRQIPRQWKRKRRTGSFEARLKRLCRERDRVAADLGIDSSLVAPRALLERGLERIDAGGDPTELAEMRRWQARLLAPLFAESA